MIFLKTNALLGIFWKEHYFRFQKLTTIRIKKATIKTDWQNGGGEQNMMLKVWFYLQISIKSLELK